MDARGLEAVEIRIIQMPIARPCGDDDRACADALVVDEPKRTILIPPSQAVADHMDSSADNAPIVNTRHAMQQREIRLDAFELGFSEPKKLSDMGRFSCQP